MTTRARAAGTLSRFAHFAGIGPKPAGADAPATDVDKVDDKVEDVKDDVDDLDDRIDDVEDKLDDKKDDDEPGDDKPTEQAAYRKGRAAGRMAERERVGAILAAPAAAQNRNLALHLAFETGTPAKSAVATLRASAAGVQAVAARAAGGLSDRMAGSRKIEVGAVATEGAQGDTAESLAQAMVATARAVGVIRKA